MVNKSKLLDELILRDDQKMVGVVDYISSKQIFFFDFTKESSIDYLLLAIEWKGYDPETRFSVFCTIYHPHLELPKAVLIPISNIKSSNHQLQKSKKSKQRRKTIKIKKYL